VNLVISFFISVSAAFFLLLLFIKTAPMLGLIDNPDRKLKLHSNPVPVVGGLSLFFVLLFSFLAQYFTSGIFSAPLFTGMILTLILGIVDDYKRLSPMPKLIVECIFSIFLISRGYCINVLIFHPYINYLLTFIWIIGIMNAFNLLDIMDGLAGSIALIVSLTLLFINISYGDAENSIILASLSGFLVSFLFFNKPEAKAYLGDSGSLLIGYVLAVVSIGTKYTSNNHVAFLTPLLIFGIPIYDTIFVSIIRLSKGKNPLHGSPDHFALKLKAVISRKGIIVLFIAFLQTIFSLFAFLSTIVNTLWALMIYAVLLSMLIVTGGYIMRIED